MRFKEGRIIRTFTLNGRKIVFRYPKKTDLDAMLRHVNGLVEEKACIAVQKKWTRAQQKKRLDDFFTDAKKGKEIIVCAEVDGEYAGNSGICKKKGDARRHMVILGIALGKDFRNMSIGTELIKTMEHLARKEMKARIMELSYFTGNERSKHVYQKLGYKEVGRIPSGINHYGKYMDEVLMVKHLK